MREVFDALGTQVKLTYTLSPSVDRDLTGNYSGSLKQVLARILAGNNYVVAITDDGVRVIVLSASSPDSMAPTSEAVAPKENMGTQQPRSPSPRTQSPSKTIPPLSSYLQ
jgi:hypothetical protein